MAKSKPVFELGDTVQDLRDDGFSWEEIRAAAQQIADEADDLAGENDA